MFDSDLANMTAGRQPARGGMSLTPGAMGIPCFSLAHFTLRGVEVEAGSVGGNARPCQKGWCGANTRRFAMCKLRPGILHGPKRGPAGIDDGAGGFGELVLVGSTTILCKMMVLYQPGS